MRTLAGVDDGVDDGLVEAKRALRRSMRVVRRGVTDPAGRSERIWDAVRAFPQVGAANVVMVFDPVPGEPDASTFAEWCRTQGKVVVIPDPSPTAAPPVDPQAIDVVVVPGVAFTAAGHRLGQGGGWYDRVLLGVRADALTLGVCFAAQLVDELPVEAHDVVLDAVVTEAGVAGMAHGGVEDR